MITFFVEKVTARWEYTFAFIFSLRGIDFVLTDKEELFENAASPKFRVPVGQGQLLTNTEIQSNMPSDDLLSQIFFVLTRMEEYFPKEVDNMGRFSAKDSWQFQNNCLEKCICDRWAMDYLAYLEEELGVKWQLQEPKVEMIPTFDIDNAFAYQFKGRKRRILSNAKDLVKGNWSRWKERKLVLNRKKNDPYDSYAKILKIATDFEVRLFWLVGDYGGKDFNISIETRGIQQLISELAKKVQIGIHPSYASNQNTVLLEREIERLQHVLSQKVDQSRQHFLKLRFPDTYQNLSKNGIKADFSMGFADAVGFRNGTAYPFPWFDLSTNIKTDLQIFPFAYMDGTLHEYLNLSPEKSKEKIKQLYEEVQEVGGQFSFIWHNETISDYGKWNGWSEVLDYTLTLKL